MFHPFSSTYCVKVRISSTSTFACLTIILFLWDHLFQTIDIYNPFHSLFPLPLNANKENCWKCTVSWLWL